MRKVDTIAGTIVDPHFNQPAAERPRVSWISKCHAADTNTDARFGLLVAQTMQPVPKFIGLANV